MGATRSTGGGEARTTVAGISGPVADTLEGRATVGEAEVSVVPAYRK